ncbi:MAG: hypothetical protein GY780_17320 [bacterium]|nr:hypothetical protein [bacterium]
MLERAKEAMRYSRWAGVEYARFADDIVILVDSHPRHRWFQGAKQRRLREELAKIQVVVNEEKTHVVCLSQGESFGFLGFEFRRIRSRSGAIVPSRKWLQHDNPINLGAKRTGTPSAGNPHAVGCA